MPVFDCIIMANFFLEKMKCAENEKKVAVEGIVFAHLFTEWDKTLIFLQSLIVNGQEA